MKKRLGISIYPEKVDKAETIEYIKMAHKAGFERIFANLLGIKNNKEGNRKIKILKDVYTFARDLGFEVILDVNPNFYKSFDLKNTELQFFYNLGATGIRLDEDFKGLVESQLSNNDLGMKIELNASGGSDTIVATLEKGGNPKNLIACHNFYPMRYTGLKYERFIQLSALFQAKGIRVAAFVTLPKERNGVGPWNVNEGMPTIEEHRFLSVSEQVMSLLELDVVDDIIISQQGATQDDFDVINDIMKKYNIVEESNVINLTFEPYEMLSDVEKSIISFERSIDFEGNIIKAHSNRPDINGHFVRSTITRLTYKDDAIKPKNAGKKLKRGDVVILNENLGRYKGELHLIIKDIDDGQQLSRNLVGRIAKDDLYKLSLIKGGRKFMLNNGSR